MQFRCLARWVAPILLCSPLAALATEPTKAAAVATPAPAPAAIRNLSPADVFELEWASDPQIIKPMIKAAAQRYVTEKKLTMRSCADEIAADTKGGAPAAAPAAVKTVPPAKK